MKRYRFDCLFVIYTCIYIVSYRIVETERVIISITCTRYVVKIKSEDCFQKETILKLVHNIRNNSIARGITITIAFSCIN